MKNLEEKKVKGRKVRKRVNIFIFILDLFTHLVVRFSELGILLGNKIPASMKQDTYHVTVAFSPSGILACKCDCKAGSQLFDKVVCVHTLPVLMQFLIFLIEDLGQNILIELCSRWNQSLNEKLKSQHISICDSMIQLMKSIGVPEADLKKAKLSDTIQDMLDDFCVGTEKRKQRPLPPRDDQLCPLRLYDHVSTSSSLKKKLVGLVKDSITDDPTTSPTTLPTTSPTTSPKTLSISQSPPTILKMGDCNVLEPVICDLCKKPDARTTHVCRHVMLNNGPKIIEGETSRICGLALCIMCKLDKMGEVEDRTSCPIHCKHPTMSTHPLLESTFSLLQTATETTHNDSVDDNPDEKTDDILNLPIKKFIPDYERISYIHHAMNRIYKEDDNDGFNNFIGNQLVHLRAKEVIEKMNRRDKYIKNEKHVMLKSMKKCFKMTLERKKDRKEKRISNILNESNEDDEQNDNFILSQEDSNTLNLDEDVILSQESEFIASPDTSPVSSPVASPSTSQSTNETSLASLSNPSLAQLTTSSSSAASISIPSTQYHNSTSSLSHSSQSTTTSFCLPCPNTNINTLAQSTTSSSSSTARNISNLRRRLPSCVNRHADGSAIIKIKKRKESERSSICKCCFPRCENRYSTKIMKAISSSQGSHLNPKI